MFCIVVIMGAALGLPPREHPCIGSYATKRLCDADALRMVRSVTVGDNERIGFRCDRVASRDPLLAPTQSPDRG